MVGSGTRIRGCVVLLGLCAVCCGGDWDRGTPVTTHAGLRITRLRAGLAGAGGEGPGLVGRGWGLWGALCWGCALLWLCLCCVKCAGISAAQPGVGVFCSGTLRCVL